MAHNPQTVSSIVIVLCIILTLCIIIFYRYHVLKTINKLDEMLEKAINGSFGETAYDESRLSALETKLNRYLSICTVSSKNLSEEKEKVKTLISDISHQTKTPLANILLYSQILLEKAGRVEAEVNTEPRGQLTQMEIECIRQICTQSEKLDFLISALIKTSRLETGIISVKPELQDVNQLIETALKEILPKAEAKSIKLNRSHYNGTACFDRKWTAEALFNILDNAVKYTPDGGSITISATAYELFYRIDIADNGIGIAEEELSKIFGRFYRSLEVNQDEGVGIGLYLAREIISAQGGYIKVKSRRGFGSVFSVFLPIDK
jgi:signal transduction histidine kinase